MLLLLLLVLLLLVLLLLLLVKLQVMHPSCLHSLTVELEQNPSHP
jgi:hypothetical protein